MGVTVGETPARPADPDRRASRAAPLSAGLLALVALVLLVVFPSLDPSPAPVETSTELSAVALPESGRWIPRSDIPAFGFDVERVGDGYLFTTSDGRVATLDENGLTTIVRLPGIEQLRGATADGDRTIAFGLDESGPALWVSTGGDWRHVRLPWDGTVQAVAIDGARVTVLGFDTREGTRRVAATGDAAPLSTWDVRQVDAPDAAILGVDGGFVARGRMPDGAVGYLHSSDGRTWDPVADVIISPVGDLAEIVMAEDGLGVRLIGDDRVFTPPDWPVNALWDRGDRIWMQTPSAAWWTEDGETWNALPLDRDHGIESGVPIILPFDDRVIVTVNSGSGREVLVWHLGR